MPVKCGSMVLKMLPQLVRLAIYLCWLNYSCRINAAVATVKHTGDCCQLYIKALVFQQAVGEQVLLT